MVTGIMMDRISLKPILPITIGIMLNFNDGISMFKQTTSER